MTKISSSSGSGRFIDTILNVDTWTLPRIDGSRRDAEICKFRIDGWFKKEDIISDENKFNYIIDAAEDEIVRDLKEKKDRKK